MPFIKFVPEQTYYSITQNMDEETYGLVKIQISMHRQFYIALYLHIMHICVIYLTNAAY